MTVSYLAVPENLKPYIPEIKQPSIPVLSGEVQTLFSKIEPHIPQSQNKIQTVCPLHVYVKAIEKSKKDLDTCSKNEKTHKIVSIVLLATWVATLATLILLTIFVPPVGIPALIGFGAAILIASIPALDSLEEFRSGTGLISPGGGGGFGLGAFPLGIVAVGGLPIPIYYVVAAFQRKSLMQGNLKGFQKNAALNNTRMQTYICTHYASLKETLTRKLQELEIDLQKFKGISEKELQNDIRNHKQALAELEALKDFYS